MCALSSLEKLRSQYKPKLPSIFDDIQSLTVEYVEELPLDSEHGHQLKELFPHSPKPGVLHIKRSESKEHRPLNVGVVLSGGQAPGGHNVITGAFDALKKLNDQSRLIGFLDGPAGIIDNKYIEINDKLLESYRNQGGFHMIGAGRTKIETPEQLQSALETAKAHHLDGILIIGGDDSNTNAALLSEYFSQNQWHTKVIGLPKTIDGDLKSQQVEISFGFDTAAKTFSQEIGNILRDAMSAKKYTFFIKLMGRSASHITLECALQTHPNLALISEEVAAKKKTFQQLVSEIADLISERADHGKNYGAILIPEGVIEFIPNFKVLITEINRILAEKDIGEIGPEKVKGIVTLLTTESAECFAAIPNAIQQQLLMDRDPHGNVKVSKIDTERLFLQAVKQELDRRKKAGSFKGKFSAQPLFLGYEGRSCLPSNFDSQYCYSLGHVAALLIDAGITSHICAIQNLTAPVEEWIPAAVSLVAMMSMEERKGQYKPVIKKALVDLDGKPYQLYNQHRKSWRLEDNYVSPGSIQFWGCSELTESTTITLRAERQKLEKVLVLS